MNIPDIDIELVITNKTFSLSLSLDNTHFVDIGVGMYYNYYVMYQQMRRELIQKAGAICIMSRCSS